jgi:hypothetical protein
MHWERLGAASTLFVSVDTSFFLAIDGEFEKV